MLFFSVFATILRRHVSVAALLLFRLTVALDEENTVQMRSGLDSYP
jgi:hypothetical protein